MTANGTDAPNAWGDSPIRVAGAVLCGGASRRMGVDKATMLVDGEPCAVRVARALHRAGAEPVIAVGGRLEQLRAMGLDVVADQFPDEGPLGGIICALAALAEVADVVVVLACDLPDAHPDAVIRVVQPFFADDTIDVVIPRKGGRRHMHHGAWHTRLLPTLRGKFAAGERAPRRVLDDVTVLELDADADFDPRWLRDLDEPADIHARRATSGRTDIGEISQT